MFRKVIQYLLLVGIVATLMATIIVALGEILSGNPSIERVDEAGCGCLLLGCLLYLTLNY